MYIQTLAAFIIYFSILFFIALASSFRKKVASSDDSAFMVGDRSINFWLTAISAHASDMSNWLFMAYPAMIFTYGLPAVWVAIGLTTYMFLNWHFIAPKLRAETEKYKTATLSSYFAKRFSDDSGILGIVGSIISLVFFIVYVAAGFKGIGFIFESAFNFSYDLGIVMAIVVVMSYTVVGGFVAVAWTDFFQGMFLLAMIILVPVMAFYKIDGVSAIKAAVQMKGVSLGLFSDYSPMTILNSLMLAFGWGLGYFGQPHILTKFMGINKTSDMYKSKYFGITWQVLSLGAATLVGLVSLAYFNNGVPNSEMIFVYMVKRLFSPFWGGFVLCAIFAAIISTIDSQVLVLASTVTEDFYKGIFRKNASKKEQNFVFRITIFVVCIISAMLASSSTYTVENFVWLAWTGIGSAFAPLVVMSLYAKNINKQGALAGMVSGCAVAMSWGFVNNSIHAMVPAFIVGIVVIKGVSLLRK